MRPWTLAVDVGGTNVRTGTFRTGILSSPRSASWPSAASASADLEWLEGYIAAHLNAEVGVLNGVAFAFPGLLKDGEVDVWPNRPWWKGVNLAARFEARFGVPCHVEDDANAAAYGAWATHLDSAAMHALYVNVGTGIGAGLILQGSLWRGRHGWAGELGHCRVADCGTLCSCGRQGCLQALAAGRTLDALAREHGHSDVAQAPRGAPWWQNFMRSSGVHVAHAAANAVNLLDLDAVLVGGSVTENALWWEAFHAEFDAALFQASRRRTYVKAVSASADISLKGAALLAEHSLRGAK